MAKSRKKTKEKLTEEISFDVTKIETYMPCEWVVQFDDDEPQIFAFADEKSETRELVIRLENNSESHITFTDTHNGKKFKIYARPKK